MLWSRPVCCSRRPMRRKALQPLRIADMGSYNMSVGKRDRRRGRDPKRRAIFQRRDCVHGKSNSAVALGPVESVHPAFFLASKRVCIVSKQDVSGILSAASYDKK